MLYIRMYVMYVIYVEGGPGVNCDHVLDVCMYVCMYVSSNICTCTSPTQQGRKPPTTAYPG